MAVLPIARGAAVRKYGQIIGFATADIVPGQWVHTHNVEAGTLRLDYAFASDVRPAPAPLAGRTFMGYRRADGPGHAELHRHRQHGELFRRHFAVRREQFDQRILEYYPNIDGVVPLVHKTGSAMQYGGDDHQQLRGC